MTTKLDASQLLNADNFTGPPVKKTVKWKQDGEELEAEVFVRKLPYQAAVDDSAAMNMDERLSRQVALCVCDENGQPVFTAGDITGAADPERGPMRRELFIALVNVVGEVNHYAGKTKRRRSSTRSGTSSSSAASAARPSRKRSRK
ncbi:phage tail assembly chaperone family protein, TAC [Methylophaga sp. OBS4]|uniref:phage tail assembly chaperone family protein, TAC n=1 Tax=Methylophaga sp. OBS4 TaxID=2991935 RepID=UPI002251B4D8|nr:phage tail assembly chaperone family protein, TAC [Methylophaga sp. OBS4]MCX4186774.1 phage tail assembly chaperone family protein, TAC [Methylophaga sp. OBS4]